MVQLAQVSRLKTKHSENNVKYDVLNAHLIQKSSNAFSLMGIGEAWRKIMNEHRMNE